MPQRKTPKVHKATVKKKVNDKMANEFSGAKNEEAFKKMMKGK